MKLAVATNINRKSGGAEWRDLLWLSSVLTQTRKPDVFLIICGPTQVICRVTLRLHLTLQLGFACPCLLP